MESVKSNHSSDSKLHFLDYWRVIRIRKFVILAVFLLVVVTTTAVTLLLPKTYLSTTRIAVDKDTSDIAPLLGMQSAVQYDPYFIETQFQTIQSKLVLYKVIEDLKLNEKWTAEFKLDSQLTTRETYNTLTRMIDVRQSRNTSLIEIRVYNRDPKQAALIADKIAEVYRETRFDMRTEMSRLGIEALEIKLEEQNKNITEAQSKVDRLQAEHQISDFNMYSGISFAGIEPETVRRMEAERIDAEAQYVQMATMLKELTTSDLPDLSKSLSVAYSDPQLSELLVSQAEAELKFASAAADLGPQNPEVKRLQALKTELTHQISMRVDAILKGMEIQAMALRARADQLENEVTAAKKKDTEMAEKYRPYMQAKRELENYQKIRDAILLRTLQEEVDASLPTSAMVRVIDQAEAPTRAVRPNVPLNIALGVVVGLVLGVGLAFFIEYLDTSVKTIDDVERALDAPVLGVIPQNVGALIEEGPDSPHAEAYRVLRTNVLFSRKDEDLKTLTVVSGGAGEGKSTTIFNLATIFAQHDHRVLVVDSDLRRPSIHKILNVSNSSGLTNLLLKQNTMEEVIQTTTMPNLDFLPSGKLPSSSMGILNSSQMREFIKEAKKRYDFVFFDSPPIMGVSDASILASEVDLTLLVIQYRKYPQAMTVRAKQMVEKVGGKMLGVVLNNINISQDSYYYYYSGYYYDYYSKQDDDESTPESGKKSKGQKNGSHKTAAATPDRGNIEINQKY